MIFTLTLENISEIGKQIRSKLKPGMIVSISGALGVGKTTLIKHILSEYEISSASFSHAIQYGDNFLHIDAYMFRSKEFLLSLNLEEELISRCVLIEFGNLVESLFDNFFARIVKIEITTDSCPNQDKRLISIDGL